MTEEEFTLCRVCNEYLEQQNMFELFDNQTKIVTQIKEVFGVELLNGEDIPSSICRQCYADFESAQEFRQRCIESNEYFGSNYEQNIKCEEVSKEETDEERVQSNHNVSKFKEEVDQNQDDDAEISASRSKNDKASKFTKPGKQKSSKRKEFKVNWKQKLLSNTPLVCDVCGAKFKRRHSLGLHQLRSHSKSKPYGCGICSSAFCTNSELTRHMRQHTGEKPYECQYCHRRFSDYTTHVKHERTHTNESPFSCTVCGKDFSCAFILKSHMLVHTGERAFRCEVCDKSFNRQHNLVSHMKTISHHKNILEKSNKSERT